MQMGETKRKCGIPNATPRVSICLPTLNSRPFLQERFETIFGQTFQDWELFVYDSYSEDGTWEFIQSWANRETRLRAVQGPREGPYPAWNECVRQTQGEFVYIATSDDTMAPDCLERLVSSLEQHPECDLAHCPLVIIDETGLQTTGLRWPECTVLGNRNEQLLSRTHVRRAPYDGLLHLMGRHVYYSITQLLIRRLLFDRIGDFPFNWGAASDFNWEMKAGLVANTVYVADTWASWRIHPNQITATTRLTPSAESERKVEEMIEAGFQQCQQFLDPLVLAELQAHWLARFRELRRYHRRLWEKQSTIARWAYRAQQLLAGTETIRSHLITRALGRPWPESAAREVRHWLETVGRGPVINYTRSMSPLASNRPAY
jgi:glycosyltransferase involved in cell wall biosynthesis